MALRSIEVTRYSPVGGKGGMIEDKWKGDYIKYQDHLEMVQDHETRCKNHWDNMKNEQIQELVAWKVEAIKRYPDLVHLPFPPPTPAAHS